MTDVEQRKAAAEFAARWKGKGYEKGESQVFWLELLHDVLGVARPGSFISFEQEVHLDHTAFIDGMIKSTKVMIEQKSVTKDLRKGIRQSDGAVLSPFLQAKRYIVELPVSEHPRYVITCNFREFFIYDMEKPQGEPEIIELKDLPKEVYRLKFLVSQKDVHLEKEIAVSVRAGELVGKLYDKLHAAYLHPDDENSLKALNVLCVRLVFCLYAEDAGIFGTKSMFHDYLASFRTKNVRRALMDLFETLDTKPEDRDPYMDDTLAAFPYVNGGLFAAKDIEIPKISDGVVELLMVECSEQFDWEAISPTIFGAVFESTLSSKMRRSGGMHYTSIENIHKVIDPLFLDDLKQELEDIKAVKVEKTRDRKLAAFQDQLASLTFFDPACGSGNFLTETYLSLRRLENEAISLMNHGQMVLGGMDNPIKVSISHFYGIEINDFAVTVAKTALWIAESQMMKATEDIVYKKLDFLPLTTNAFIHEGNALTIPWESIIPANSLFFLEGNPPFSGARIMSSAQKEDVKRIFPGWKNVGNLDYVSCWFKKAADYIKGTSVRAALVSTNSICQGDSVATLWKPLFAEGVHFDFAYRTFRWDSESSSKAHVHCVILGFSTAENDGPKFIFDGGQKKAVSHINAYLYEGGDVFVESRSRPLCDVPEIGIGNKPIDGGNYLFTKEEMEAFIAEEPASAPLFHPWYGSREFINRAPRYCLWLGNCTPAELRRMPHCLERISRVRTFRLKSKSAGTRKLADRPTRFHVENMPKTNYIVIPEVSSQRRRYVPMGYMMPNVLCSNKVRLMPNAGYYEFGVLESNVHMAWMRVVCGRLKSDYDYSINIVYNNFPWPPAPTDAQKAKIEKMAQAILEARAQYPDSTLADLYDPLTMPAALLKAHQENDKAVMSAYGWDWRGMSESDCVARLMEMYEKLVQSGRETN